MQRHGGISRMRVLVMLMWSGILCLHSIASSVEAVHPSSSTKSQQQQLVDRISQHRLPTISSSASASSDQTSLQPLDSDDTEIVKSQSIDDDTRTFLETDSEDRGREKDNNWTGYAALVLPDFESSGEAGDSTMGKTDADVEKRVWKGSGKLGQKESGKRKWSSTNLAMWGKRKWAASNMAMWGKRHLVQPEKRKWNGNSMAMWGKRDLTGQEMDEEKRKWNGNSMAMWGKRDLSGQESDEEKRKWNGNSMAMWGKRDLSGQGEWDEEKRKWNGNSMAMWGKRDLSGQEMDEEKRKWNGNSMAMWGKRDLSGQESNGEKRKWNGNSMAMWGKRDSVQGEFTEPEWQRVVRGWSGNNLAMWGKRDIAKKLSH